MRPHHRFPLPRRRWLALAVVSVAVLLASPAPGAALLVYGPSRALDGAGGCLRDVSRQAPADLRCPGSAQGLSGVQALALSPDGRNLYAAAPGADAVVVLSRDLATGALRSPLHPSARDCVQAPGGGRCRVVDPALSGADALAVSPDGRFVYVGAADSAAVSAFARLANGPLRPLAATVHPPPARPHQGKGKNRGRAPQPSPPLFYGCVQGNLLMGLPTACAGHQLGLDGVRALAVSPDGHYLYAVSTGTVSGEDSVVTLARDRRTGGLAPLAAVGCIQSRPALSCARSASGLEGASSLLVSRDGRYVYVASQLSAQVVVFRRNRLTGVLSPLSDAGGCVSDSSGARAPQDDPCLVTAGPLGGASSLVLTPDGSELLVAASDPGAVIALRRNPVTGQLGPLAAPPLCLQALADAACPAGVPSLRGTAGLALSPSGRVVYVAATGANSVLEMLRDPVSGHLQLATLDSAMVDQANGPTSLIASARGPGLYLSYPFEDAVGVLTG